MERIKQRWLGAQCGSSLDGLDVAVVTFSKKSSWYFSFEYTQTFTLPSAIQNALLRAQTLSWNELSSLLWDFSQWVVEVLTPLCKAYQPEGIGFHGPTLFFIPQRYHFSLELPAVIAHGTQTLCVHDFRNGMIAKGCKGAPLAPIMERYLFPQYRFFLNLGGIANLSCHTTNEIMAFDVVGCNQVLNFLARQKGKAYDYQGKWARQGKVLPSLLEQLNQWTFLQKTPPKALDNHTLQTFYFSVLSHYPGSVEDKLRTVVEHIAQQIAKSLACFSPDVLFITGGGAYNAFLIERLQYYLPHWQLKIPSKELIEFKEALLFAFLALLCYERLDNTLAASLTFP